MMAILRRHFESLFLEVILLYFVSPEFIAMGPIKSVLVQVMAWHQTGDKSSSKTTMT